MPARSRKLSEPAPGAHTSESEPFLFLNRQRKHRVDRRRVLEFLSRLTSELTPPHPFSVVLVSDRAIQDYNRSYRGVGKPTDVLSFRDGGGYLGDILISTETAYDQSLRSKTLTLDKNVERLALHGFLHLMGYDHETDNGEMRALELRLRRRFQC